MARKEDAFSKTQESRLDALMFQRLKSTRHENDDHLNRAMLVRKLRASTVDGAVLRSANNDSVWRRSDSEIDLMRQLGSTVIAQTLPGYAAGDAVSLVDAQAQYAAVYLPYSVTIDGIAWAQRTQGSTTGDQTNQVGLYTTDGTTLTRVAVSADDSNMWDVAVGWQTKAFSTAYAATGGQVLYVAMVANWSAVVTTPQIAGSSVILVALLNQNMANPLRAGGIAAQNSLPSTQALSGLSAANTLRWFGLYT